MVTRRMIQKPYLFLLYNLESEGAIRETRTAILLRHALTFISAVVWSNTSPFTLQMTIDDWKQFALELWGIRISTWPPDPERDGTLPLPLDYDVLQDGLVELEIGQRQMVLQSVSCYQVILNVSFCLLC